MDLNAPDSSTFTPSSAGLADIEQKVFKNDLILEEIIKKLQNSADLVNCRLVDKSWKHLATERLQKKNWVERKFLSLTSVRKIQEYCKTYGEIEDTKIQKTVLFSCLHIKNLWDARNSPDEAMLALDTVCRTFPQKIKCLDLSIRLVPLTPHLLNCVLESQSSSLCELRIEYPNCLNLALPPPKDHSSNYLLTNLKYLCLSAKQCTRPSRFDRQCLITNLELICSKIPHGNPNSVKICLMGWRSRMTGTIAVLKQYDLTSSLKIQKLATIRRGHCQKLAESGVKLEFLRIVPLDPYEIYPGLTQEICQLLQSQSRSLERFEWCGEGFEFPNTPMNLRKLKLNFVKDIRNNQAQDQDGNDPPLPVEHIPILYGQCFPKLEFLELSSLPFYEQPLPDFHSMFLTPQFPCVNLQIVKLRTAIINAQTINLVSEIFPRLKFLDVGPYNDEEGFGPEEEQMFYSALWSANFASTVEEFAINLDQPPRLIIHRRRPWNQFELDSFFSGVNIDLIQQVDCSSGEYYQIQNPSILSFLKLKKLDICAYCHVKSPGACFTDFSAFTLFGQLKNLEYLHVDKNVHEFTETAIEHMKRSHENNVRILSEDHSFTSTERIEKAFKTDWTDTKNFHEASLSAKSFNLLV